MAGKGGKKKDASQAPRSDSGGLVILIQAICAALAVLGASILAVGAFGLGPAAVTALIHSLAPVPIGLVAVCGLAAVFLASPVRDAHARKALAGLEELEQRLGAQVGEALAKVDAHIGDDYQLVREHNRQLQDKIEQFRQSERDKLTQEMEKLRALNGELEAQIKRWAIGSVDQMVSETGSEGVKVA